MSSGPRDHLLIDTLERLPLAPFRGKVWRITRENRDPTLFFGGGNRWDDGQFDVLYTSLSKEVALAEMKFHVRRGQPVIPSKIKYGLHELDVSVDDVMDLTNQDLLASIGIDVSWFGRLPYVDRQGEYEACQRIGETVHFLGSDEPGYPSAMLVPSARYDGTNLVLLADYMKHEDVRHVKDHGVINWKTV